MIRELAFIPSPYYKKYTYTCDSSYLDVLFDSLYGLRYGSKSITLLLETFPSPQRPQIFGGLPCWAAQLTRKCVLHLLEPFFLSPEAPCPVLGLECHPKHKQTTKHKPNSLKKTGKLLPRRTALVCTLKQKEDPLTLPHRPPG